MRDVSSRSSAVGSAHPSPRDDVEESPAKEREQSGDVAPIVMEVSPASIESSKPSDANGLGSREFESQPMTKSDSLSSNPSANDAATGSTASAVPYGTRSRNRTGNSRPNYAEDREIDLELEVAPSAHQSTARKTKTAEPSAATDAGRSIPASRKGLGSDGEQNLLVQSHYKEPIPGTSTFSANPAVASNPPNGSKKRKATNQHSVSQHQHQMATPNLSTHSITRGAHMATQINGGVQDSNMLTFEACQGRPKGGTLVSDDGTVLKINGKLVDLAVHFTFCQHLLKVCQITYTSCVSHQVNHTTSAESWNFSTSTMTLRNLLMLFDSIGTTAQRILAAKSMTHVKSLRRCIPISVPLQLSEESVKSSTRVKLTN